MEKYELIEQIGEGYILSYFYLQSFLYCMFIGHLALC